MVEPPGVHDIKYLPHPSPTTTTTVDSMPSATYPSSAGHEYAQSPFGTHHPTQHHPHHHGDASGGAAGAVNGTGAGNGVVDAFSAAAGVGGMTRHLSISSAYPNPYGGLPVQPFTDPHTQNTAAYSQDISPPPSAYPMHPPPTPYSTVPPNSATFAPTDAEEAAMAAANGMMGSGMPGDGSMQMNPDGSGGAASWGFYPTDTTLHLKIQTLPVLDNLVSYSVFPQERLCMKEPGVSRRSYSALFCPFFSVSFLYG